MKNFLNKRAISIGKYILKTGQTVRQAAVVYGVSKSTVHNDVSKRLKKGKQTAEDVFKTRIGTCEGYANLYSKMLNIVGIQNEKVQGFAIEGMRNSAQAKNRVKRETIGHVWNKINIPGHKNILVDITWMSRGQTAQTQKRLTPHMKKQELRKIKREQPIYTYNMKYFDFNYKNLQKNGEYRFLSNYQMLK